MCLTCMSHAIVIYCSWYTTMLGKKSSVAPVLAFLTENGVGININFTRIQ